MTQSASQRINTGIALAFIAAVILLGARTLNNGEWRGMLIHENHTWIIDLPTQPVWNPPELPKYSDFWQFDDVPAQQLAGSRIAIEMGWEYLAGRFLIELWYLLVFFSVVTLFAPQTHRNLGISLIRALTVSLSVAAVACIGLWLLLGGWGPPFPLSFGLLGILTGLVLGALNGWQPTRSTRPSTDSQRA